MSYSQNKKSRKIKRKIENILLFPVRCICTPIYKISQKYKNNKIYSDKEIKKTVQYLIDYWTDGESEFYIFIDDGYKAFDYSNVTTPFYMQADMGWSRNKKIKTKASHMYYHQKDKFLIALRELCGAPMSYEDKIEWFDKYRAHEIKNRELCKIK